MLRTIAALLVTAAVLPAQKTSLLPDAQLNAIAGEASGGLALDTIIALGRFHRVHASPGFHEAALYIAAKAREYGLEDVHIESCPADGKTTYNTFRSYYGWEASKGMLREISPHPSVIGDYSKAPVALADYSNNADVFASLVDVGSGVSAADYAGKDVKGRIVLAGGGVAEVHRLAVEERGAAGILSYQSNQPSGWSGDYPDNIRWGHLSPYNLKNTFAFMISLREAREFRSRLARGEEIHLHAEVEARMRPGEFEVVTGIIRGSDPNAGEVVFSCHLCHQKGGANDNASGAATILEDARVLAKLIREGRLPRPRRTIRFLWPPEIAGTMCYLARHPNEVRKMIAAIHMDMVGGDPHITKAVLHLTHTPASLPSFVNDVAAVFGEYVMEGSRRMAATGDASDALIDPAGSKEGLVADFAPFSMGSDHDVYQEGSFRVPAIYMNDWPDVFIHTNRDVASNMDATKLRRVAVIGGLSGYFLASAGPAEAELLTAEVVARGMGRIGEGMRKRQVSEATRQQQEVLLSVEALGGDRRTLQELAKRVETLVPPPPPAEPTVTAVPRRNPAVVGNLNTYYYDYIADHVRGQPQGRLSELLEYEILNLVDGKRSVEDIRKVIDASYGPISREAVYGFLKLLEQIGVVSFDKV